MTQPLQAAPQEWLLVPFNPTLKMLEQAREAWPQDPLARTSTIYQTMLAYAPKPPRDHIILKPEAIAALKDALKRGNAMGENEAAPKLELLHDWLAGHMPICLGECEFCTTQLIEGEPGFRYSESTVCAACAPSYREVKLAAEHEPDTWETELDRRATLAEIQKHIGDGGSLDDTMTVTL